MPVTAWLEGTDHTAPLRVVTGRPCLTAGTRRADLTLDGHRHVEIDQTGPEERRQPQDHGSRVAAWRSDVACGLDLLAMEFWQAVHRLAQEFRPRMRPAIPDLVGLRVAQPEICREIDHHRCQLQQAVDDRSCLPVRQAGEEDIDRLERLRRDEFERRPLAQVRMDGMNELPGARSRGYLLDFHLRVTQQQAQEFPAGIAGTTQDRNRYCHPATASPSQRAVVNGSEPSRATPLASPVPARTPRSVQPHRRALSASAP